MSTAALTEIASYDSAHVATMNALSGGQMTLFNKAFRATRNYSLQHIRSTKHNSTTGGQDAAEYSFAFDRVMDGDLVTGAYLEVQLPALDTESGTKLPTYVWAVGYALINHADFMMGGKLVERLQGDYMEMRSELHQPAGRTLQEQVFKLDRVTVPELSVASQSPITLYVPLPFFFTHGPHCVLPIGKSFQGRFNNMAVTIDVTTRAIREIAQALPVNSDTTTVAIPKPLGKADELSWNDIKIQLYVSVVYLERQDSEQFFSNGGRYRAICTTVQSLTDSSTAPRSFSQQTYKQSKIPFRYPVKCLMWAIADDTRVPGRSLQAATHTTGQTSLSAAREEADTPYTSGMAKLFGQKASHYVVSDDNTISYNTDWNSKMSTVKMLHLQDSVTPIYSSKDVREWRNDGNNECLHLIGNRFDYRAHDGEKEVDSMKSISLKLANQARWDEHLGTPVHESPEMYFRVVQGLQHFRRVPRKGIYLYSFAQQASNPLPTGTVNFTKITDKDLQVVTNTTNASKLIMYAESLNIFTLDARQGFAGMEVGSHDQ
jgi:hypothetical protein